MYDAVFVGIGSKESTRPPLYLLVTYAEVPSALSAASVASPNRIFLLRFFCCYYVSCGYVYPGILALSGCISAFNVPDNIGYPMYMPANAAAAVIIAYCAGFFMIRRHVSSMSLHIDYISILLTNTMCRVEQ